MKIGIVSQSYYPRYGGVTEHVHHLGMELRRRGHEVIVVTARFPHAEAGGELQIQRVGHNLLVPFNRAWVDMTIGLRLRAELRAVLQECDFDLLHTHCPTAPTLPLMAVQMATCPQVGTFHTTAGTSVLHEMFRGYLNRTVVDRLDQRIAVSRTAREWATRYHPAEYVVIPNGVDIDRFHPSVMPLHAWRDPGKVNLLFVGRLDPRKGLQFLLAAMPEVLRLTGERARLLVVGDGYLRTRYESSVPSAARDSVHFVGRVSKEELPRWYATGDVFVSPASSHESFGIVLAEAMAAGRAVVASDIPGYRTVLNPGENGVVFPPGDVGTLARTIAALVNDADRRRALGERGRTASLEYAWPRVTDRIEEVYRQALGRKTMAHTAA